MIIQNMKLAAESVGINAFITNSDEKIETQLNRLTREEQLPLILISWDIKAALEFDINGFLGNPRLDIVSLLVTKPEDMSKDEAESSAEEMAELFKKFLISLSDIHRQYMKTIGSPITNANYQLVPRHGAGKHSGVLGRFTVADQVIVDCV